VFGVLKRFSFEGGEGVIVESKSVAIGSSLSLDMLFADVVGEILFTFRVYLDLGGLERLDKEGLGGGGDGLLGHEALSSICERSEGSGSPSRKARVLISDIVK